MSNETRRTVIYGASDDLIEIDGTEIREEFSAYDDPERYVGLSNGVLLAIHYDSDSYWRIRPVRGNKLVTLIPAPGEDSDTPRRDEDGCPPYSDKAVIDGEVTWVSYGQAYVA